MKQVLAFVMITLFAGLLSGCTSGSMSPIGSAVCDVEKVALTGVSQSIAGILNCSAPDAIETSLEQALGNVNFCKTPVQQDSASDTVKALVAGQNWQTIGDIHLPLSQSGAKSLSAAPQGVIGALACPIIVNTVLGYLTSSIRSSWKCSNSASAGTVASAITAACVAAIPF